ncbi:hypothetical protein LN565_00765 [Xanthomonas euvesicatoria pv. euvesicatoria]|uniref:hypothetical protein n=1 Tax=Xanthomonas TaxID=338 RepID=UPI00062D6E37|nr:hypothetical protein [Xanthomonas euvesicatoria]KLA50857.1 hypothetical protein XEUV683_17505 [Xanthomonas euvesicatoria]KLA58949.1 hypothetical protein XEUV684_12385 [Xanthomonas euvesicatoria]KLA60071.1 hypothetical protein XEUV685_02165 [Xanthomonas euvesicatoria]KLA63284.1 hypothetical protein XEUV689_20480 [Xanthomonas euvesicatoria]KLA66175.1 hypothetical protein XEUV695_13100 [Xanthomonas euvesicatoria]
MSRKIALAPLLGALLLTSGTASAIDAASVQAYCDQVRQSAQQAKQRHVQIFAPRQDPGKTFDDATQSCLDGIMSYKSMFQFKMPSLGDVQGILSQMAKEMLNKQCQAARAQFDRAVQDAVSTVNQSTNQLPGVDVDVSTGSGVTVNPKDRESTIWGSIVNKLGGDK